VRNPGVAGAVALALALVCTPAAMVLARRAGVVDRPGPLKPHQAPVPYLGGAAVFVAVAPSIVAYRPWLLLPLGGALALGVADDVRGLPPRARLVGELALGAGIAAALPTRLAQPWSGLAIVAVTVVLVNGVNLLDGLDALAGGVLAVGALGWAVLLGGAARALAAAAVGALVGFLAYNRPPARIYLGDGGAYLLGALATVLVVAAWAPGRRPATNVAALLPAAVPAAEVAFAVVRRARAGAPLLSGDRRHPYDLLVTGGWSAARAAGLYATLAGALVVAALVAAGYHSLAGALAVAGAGAVGLVAGAARCGALRPEGEVSR